MKIQDVSSLETAAGLTPGVSLNPFKCWTARFTGLGGRLAWLLIEFVEGSPHSHHNSCKDTKKTVHSSPHCRSLQTYNEKMVEVTFNPLFAFLLLLAFMCNMLCI